MSHGELPHDHGKKTAEVFDKMPQDSSFETVADIFDLLRDKNRLKILWILFHCEDCVINISAMMEMSSPAVSHHLKILKTSGLIVSRREGKEVYYKAAETEQVKMLHDTVESLMAIICPMNKDLKGVKNMLNDFRGEVWINTHEDILNAMIKANSEPVDGGYSVESYAEKATELMQQNFADKIYTTFAMNGTAANIIALKAMLDRWDSIICAEQTHVHTYEAGAFEYNLGNKILTIPSPDGKITVELIEELKKQHINHKYLPKVITLAQPTEFGTVYTPDELKAICDYAHENGMYVYLDGARLFTAIASLDTDIRTMIEYPDIDAFTFGGTKAGAMFGEMVIFRRKEFARNLTYSQKQSLQHLSKSKFLSVQLVELLRDGLWFKHGKIATDMAKLLEKKLAEKGIKTAYKVQSNLLFCIIDHETVARITKEYSLHYWEEDKEVIRLVTTHLTTEEQIDHLISLI